MSNIIELTESRRIHILSPLGLCLAALLSTGCGNALKSDYQTPKVNYAAHWQQDNNVNGAVDSAVNRPVPFDWRDFKDPQLDNLIQLVMTNNNDIASAVSRLSRSRLDAEQHHLSSTPGLQGSLNTGSSRALDRSDPWAKSSSASLSTSYEVDLWGKIARRRDLAEWTIQASEEDLRAVRLALLADASNNYWRIGFINQQIGVLQQSIAYAQETSRVANSRYRAGAVSSLDIVDAEQSLVAQQNRLIALQRDRLLVLNQQALLLAAPPGSSVAEPSHLPTGPLPKINSGIPTSVLNHRPDIRAKELAVRQALASIDIKRAEYYPEFDLTGALGTTSNTLLTFLRNPISSVGTSLSLPFLEWRQRDVDIKITRNDYEQRVLDFKQALYIAMSAIEEALSYRDQLLAQETHLSNALALARKSERLNEVRYRQGATPITFWLEAQERRRQAELSLDDNRLNQYQNLARIYLEFGGSE